jgi:membrane protein
MRIYLCCKTLYRRLIRDNLGKEASALAYQSFMAIVPLLAVMFGIAKGFGLEQFLERWLTMELADHQEVLTYLLQFSTSALQEVQGGVIAGVGILFLLFTIVRLLASIEKVLNSMWGFSVSKTSLRRMVDYMALVLVCPLLLAISSSATICISAKMTLLAENWVYFGIAQSYCSHLISLIPFVTSSVLFALVLFSLPKAPVRPLSALISGMIAAFVFEHIQSWYIVIQLHCTKIGAVYGSFVALPLFLVWVWISWFLLLLAGELMVFIQEKGWKTPISTYEDTDFSNLATEDLVYRETQTWYREGKIMTLADLYSSLTRPIRALTLATVHLQNQGFLMGRDVRTTFVPLIPVSEKISPTWVDMIIPAIPKDLSESSNKEFAEKLSTLKEKMLRS